MREDSKLERLMRIQIEMTYLQLTAMNTIPALKNEADKLLLKAREL